MNILFFLYKFPIYGGVERMTISLANLCSENGHKVYIISERGNAEDMLSDLSDDIIYDWFDDVNFFSIENKNKFYSVICDYNINIIINQGCYDNVTEFLLEIKSYLKDVFVISILHNDPCFPLKSIDKYLEGKSFDKRIRRFFKVIVVFRVHRRTKIFYRKLVDESDFIVVLSTRYIYDFRKLLNDNFRNIIAIPNFIMLNNTIFNISCVKEKTILYVGRVVESQKRISRLINIWSSLYLKFPDWKLQIVGDGEDLASIKYIVDENKIERVDFVGYTNNVYFYMCKASIISLVSDFEGFPMAILEAMSVNCVPISYGSYSAIYDIIEDGKNGYIIPPFKDRVYIEKLEELLSNNQRLFEFSMAAKKKADTFSSDLIYAKWDKLFDLLKKYKYKICD